MAETQKMLTEAEKQAEMIVNLQRMQAQFIDSLDDRLDAIAESWVSLLENRKDTETLNELHRLLHSLTGTAGTYSLNQLSQKARELEVFFKGLTMMPDFELILETERQASSMLHELIHIAQNQEPVELEVPNARASVSPSSDSKRILIIEDDYDVIALLTQQFQNFGFEVASVMDLTELERTFDTFRPSIIVTDISFPESDLAGIEALKRIRESRQIDIPVIVLSARQDIEARLAAIRVGTDAYVKKPINLSLLMDKVGDLCQESHIAPPNILIVDDDIGLTQFMSVVLEKAGMSVKVVNDPMVALDALSEYMPDLILMDYHMPGCNGLELAKIIRQDATFNRVPILFLSGETDQNLQFAAMIEGGDDLIAKPVKADMLTSVVAAKARRARQLSEQIVTDGLTGLFNHSHIEYLMEQEAARASRSGNNFAVVILDIDHFKNVNDSHGHASGDTVLRSLSYMLKNRLRHTDLVGRFGGEEFVVIMPDTSTKVAKEIMEKLREVFALVVHQSTNGTEAFTVTFSAGIVDYDSLGEKKGRLLEYADEALYQAKESGRNRIICYDPM